MLTRRQFQSGFAASALISNAGCSQHGSMAAYNEANARLRETLSSNPDLSEFIRLATLAANGHNTQPWIFSLRPGGVTIAPDMTRRTPVVDPDDHHLFVSLGCAAENFLIAGRAAGQPGAAMFDDRNTGRILIDLTNGPSRRDDLFQALPQRQTTRAAFDGRAVPASDLRQLEAAAREDGVSVVFITDESGREKVLDHVIEGNNQQMDDPAFVEELRDWIRFNPSEALEKGDGLFAASSGNPILPSWLGKRLFGLFFEKKSETEKYTNQLRTSAGIAIFIGDRADEDHWVRVGRSFQRFALKATALGIRNSHINQPIEVPAVRKSFSDWLNTGGLRPDLVIRFGYGPPLPLSMRRPVRDVVLRG